MLWGVANVPENWRSRKRAMLARMTHEILDDGRAVRCLTAVGSRTTRTTSPGAIAVTTSQLASDFPTRRSCIANVDPRASVGRVIANTSRCPPFDPVREAGARTDNALFTPACSSPPSIAMRPRVAARSPMSGASWWATGAARCTSSQLGAWPPTSPRSAPFDPVRELALERIALASHRRAHRHLPSRCARALRRVRR